MGPVFADIAHTHPIDDNHSPRRVSRPIMRHRSHGGRHKPGGTVEHRSRPQLRPIQQTFRDRNALHI